MAFDRKQIQVLTQRSGASAILRFVILLLDIFTIIFLSITLGLYYSRSDWADYQSSHWVDGLVLGVVFISLIWTLIAYARSASTTALLHPGHYVAWELICWILISGSTVPALLFQPLSGIADYWEIHDKCSDAGYHAGPNCDQKTISLQRLQVAAFSFALLLSVLHFVLFVVACRVCYKYNKNKKTMHRIDRNVELDPWEKRRVEV